MKLGRISVSLLALVALQGVARLAHAEPTATLTLSTSAGSFVPPGATVTWTVSVALSEDAGSGLSAVAVDLMQSPGNPAPIVLSPAPSVPSAMAGFSRPAGVCNPGAGGTGYGGTPVADPFTTGAVNLLQIGGMQNTFGILVGTMGHDLTLETGIGQGVAPEVIASGTFVVPSNLGFYTFSLSNGFANVLANLQSPPLATTCVSVRTILGPPITLNVKCPADLDDGTSTGSPDGAVTIDDLLFFLTGFEAGSTTVDLDDGTGTGVQDGAVTIDDLLFFLIRFEAGC